MTVYQNHELPLPNKLITQLSDELLAICRK